MAMIALLGLPAGRAAEKPKKGVARPVAKAIPIEVAKVISLQPGAPISLLEAVRITLSQSPRILLEEANVEVSRGTLLARAGAFDTRFVASGSHGTRRQEILRAPAPPQTSAQTNPQADAEAPTDAPPPQPIIFPLSDLTTGQAVPGLGIIVPPQPTPEAPSAPKPEPIPVEPTVTKVKQSDFDVGLRKRLRNGGEISTQGIYSRQDQETDGPIFNISELRLTVQVPVLRAFMPSEEASFEHAAKIDYAASLLIERHVMSEAVFETARAYWRLRAAQERLDLLRASEETATSLRKLIAILIKGEERARSEIHQADARVFETSTRRISAEQSLFEARQALGLAMGLEESGLRAAPLAGDTFPRAHGLNRARAVRDTLIADAFLRRADYQASIKNEQSARVLLDSARRNLLPRLDFQLRASYFGGEVGSQIENVYGSFLGNQTGTSVFGQLSFDWPFANREARGSYIRSGAEYEQAGIRTDDLRRNIVSGIIVGINALINGSGQLQQAGEAVASYQEALETERIRYEGGDATLLDLINTEDRLTEALLTAVSARLQIAEAYARVRFESGSILSGKGPTFTLSEDVLITVPHTEGEIPLGRVPSFQMRLQLR